MDKETTLIRFAWSITLLLMSIGCSNENRNQEELSSARASEVDHCASVESSHLEFVGKTRSYRIFLFRFEFGSSRRSNSKLLVFEEDQFVGYYPANGLSSCRFSEQLLLCDANAVGADTLPFEIEFNFSDQVPLQVAGDGEIIEFNKIGEEQVVLCLLS